MCVPGAEGWTTGRSRLATGVAAIVVVIAATAVVRSQSTNDPLDPVLT
jgi:hypothetical protein